MEERIVDVLNQMAEYLNIGQMKKLQEVLFSAFAEEKVSKCKLDKGKF